MNKRAQWLAAVISLSACAPSEGTLRVLVEAEDTIVNGIPAQMGSSSEGFEDGWSLTFERFYVNVGQVTIADSQGHQVSVPMAFASGDRVFDLKRSPQTELFTVTRVPARRYERVSYLSLPAGPTTNMDAVPAEDRPGMMGVSTWITAVARKPGRRDIRIDWKFTDGWEYFDCQGPEDRPGPGTVIAEGGTTTLRITMHGDHWFWQRFAQEGSPTRFDPIANADTMMGPYRGNNDGQTTLEELDMVPIALVPPADGAFNVGGRDITTLGEYMRASTGTNGHIDGDGVCRSRRR